MGNYCVSRRDKVDVDRFQTRNFNRSLSDMHSTAQSVEPYSDDEFILDSFEDTHRKRSFKMTQCGGLESCKSVQRIITFLTLTESAYDMMDDASISVLEEDLDHIESIHAKTNFKYEQLYNYYIESMDVSNKQCDPQKCQYIVYHFEDKYTECIDDKHKLLKELRSKIHCYIVHGYDLYRLTVDETEQIYNEPYDDYNFDRKQEIAKKITEKRLSVLQKHSLYNDTKYENICAQDTIIRDFVSAYIRSFKFVFIPKILEDIIFLYSVSPNNIIPNINITDIRYKYNLYYNNLNKNRWEIYHIGQYIYFRFTQNNAKYEEEYHIDHNDYLLVRGFIRNIKYKKYLFDEPFEILYMISLFSAYTFDFNEMADFFEEELTVKSKRKLWDKLDKYEQCFIDHSKHDIGNFLYFCIIVYVMAKHDKSMVPKKNDRQFRHKILKPLRTWLLLYKIPMNGLTFDDFDQYFGIWLREYNAKTNDSTQQQIMRTSAVVKTFNVMHLDLNEMAMFFKDDLTCLSKGKLWIKCHESVSSIIEGDEIESLLYFCVLVYIKAKHKHILLPKRDNVRLRYEILDPLKTWLLQYKVSARGLTFDEFDEFFPLWLNEYDSQRSIV